MLDGVIIMEKERDKIALWLENEIRKEEVETDMDASTI